MRRFFTALQRRWLLNQQRYRCALCGKAITLRTAHADHIIPHSRGGKTTLLNGQALCRSCNLFKSNKMTATVFNATAFSGWQDRLPRGFTPRQWQNEAIEALHQFACAGDFNYSFTAKIDPGFGKTLFAALAGRTLQDAGVINWTVILVPNQNLVDQTIKDAPVVGMQLTTDAKGLDRMQLRRQGYHGEVLTYQMLLANQESYREQARIHGAQWLLVKDEVHRLADSTDSEESKAWGVAVHEALHCHVAHRIAMTGTLFRSDEYGILDVSYGPADEAGVRQVQPHFSTLMSEGIRENWVRRLLFFTSDGRVEWLESRGESLEQRAAELSNDTLKRSDRVAALQTALDVRLPFAQSIIQQGYEELQRRRAVTPDAAMIVICRDKHHARDACEWIKANLNINAPLVLGEDSRSGKAIERFKEERANNNPIIVAVKMISEGCSIKRLEVGVLLTNITTRLNFMQTGARCNRNRTGSYETGAWFIPALPEFLTYALEYEHDIVHSLVDAKDDEPKEPPKPPQLCPICEDPESSEFSGECPGPGIEPCPMAAPRKVYRVASELSSSWGIAGGESFEQGLWTQSQRVAERSGLDVHTVAQVLRHVDLKGETPAATAPAVSLDQQLQKQQERYKGAMRTVCSRLIDLGCKWPSGEIMKAINATALKLGHVRNDTRDPVAMKAKVDWLGDVENCAMTVSRYMGGQR